MEKVNEIPLALKRCAAKTRPLGIPCRNWGMPNGRCRMHGGKSTGPRTAEGRERIRQANWKHGGRSAQAREEHKEFRNLLHSAKELSGYVPQRLMDDSITNEEVKTMFDRLKELEYKLRPFPERFKHLTVADEIALGIHYQKQLTRMMEFLAGKISVTRKVK
jgi:hypothetical protein